MTRNHLKRAKAPNSWKIKRKNITFIAKPMPGPHKKGNAIPMVVLMRDILGKVKTRKECIYVLHNQEVLVNGKRRYSTDFPVGLFDIVSFPLLNEEYVLLINKKGFLLPVEAKGLERVSKIVSKTMLKKGKIQIGLLNGGTILADSKGAEKYRVGDTIVFNGKGKGNLFLNLKEGSLCYVFNGKQAGALGTITAFERDLVRLSDGGKELMTKRDYVCAVPEAYKEIIETLNKR